LKLIEIEFFLPLFAIVCKNYLIKEINKHEYIKPMDLF
jgi:hypothetical protein